MGTIIVAFGDSHLGSTTALSTPKFEIHTGRKDEIQVVEANPAQKWLYSCWQEIWRYVYTLACEGGKRKVHRIITVCLGDVVDSNHHATNQIIHEVGDQVKLAMDLLQPVRDMSDRMYGVYGTEAHSGNNNDIEHALYRTLEFDGADYQLTLNIDGTIIDVAHHSPLATLPAMYKIIADYENLPRPRYIIRGHRHLVSDTGEEDRSTRMIVCPSWQLKTTYGWRVDQRRRADIGGIIINNGVMDVSRLRYMATPDSRKVINV